VASPLATVISSFQRYIIQQYGQIAIWLQRITPEMAGVQYAASWDGDRQQVTAFSDGTYGVGLKIVQNGVTRYGYLAPVSVSVGLMDRARVLQLTEMGLVPYEGPAVRYQAPTTLSKGDVLVLADGRRFVIADRLRPYQVYGTTTEFIDKLEYREPGNIVYSIPTT
jgi:hypothetical protein